MLNKTELQIQLVHKPLQVVVLNTAEGVQLLISGGDRPHIGAVCVMDSRGNAVSHCFPGHRDDIIANKWAAEIHKKTRTAVVVSAGIHYDQISREQIQTILDTTDALLHTVLERI